MGDKEQAVSFSSGQSLAKGYYRLQATSTTAVNLSYSYGIGTIGYSFYNQLGQLVASISPEGVKKLLGTGINNYSSKTAIPFTTLYFYDVQGRLVKTQDFEQGVSELVYRKDGAIRFSRNAQQTADGKYSYTNYDASGRPVESGEYKPGTGGIAFGSANMTNILESTAANGGLTNGTQYDVVRTKYDVADNSHGQSGYAQDSYFQRGAVSMTEKYSQVVNNAPAAANLVSRSWYGYDGMGQLAWMVSNLNGLGYKTTDYAYDELGNVTKEVYQKNTAAECFVHYYEYDADMRLSAVYTNTVDNSSTKVLQAKYYYYLHGPLKRIELAGNLQGIDYTYTVDGKLKAINHANTASDPGSDGSGNGFSPDVFGMNVEYHPNDYVRSGSNISSIQNPSYPASYNGNINGISWNTRKPSSVTGQDGAVMNAYKYDAKYQLSNSGWGTPNFSANTYTETANASKEYGLTYDNNGNILTLKRNNASGATTANYTYSYTANTNKLASVSGYATYGYDAIGRLTSEVKSGRSFYLAYDVTGKVTKIYGDAAKTQLKFSFVYDETGRRIKKQDNVTGATTWYVYDGAGQLAAVYDNLDGTLKLKEQPVYAGGRLGIYFRQANNYQYQLSDHLGNVRAVINRAKLSSGNADVVFYADYYPFGTVLRSGGAGWRYGYQGENAEKDNETGWNSFELRNYDAAIGRWLSTDPYGQYASPYVGMGNNPVMMADVDGGWADGGDDPVKISWKDYKEGQVIALDPVFVSAYYGGSIRAFTPDFWDNWASSKNWFSKITYNIADPFVVYGTSFFGDPMHIGGGRANRKELTEAGVAAITSAVPLEAAFAKGSILAKGAVKGRVFWSGGGNEAVEAAAREFAIKNGMNTLEMTRAGKNLTKLTQGMSWAERGPMWKRLSTQFAKGANGTVHVFQNAGGINIESVWGTVEYQILKQNRVNVIYHIVP